ncbi:MAG: amino acid permease [Cyclobacteriaceae bacterium]|nr:amino acid permease [Cyclobacteriaceae bacterium]MCB9238062.1 amino acid permease [Flammeovirgaceae bacterium]MCO5272546.1 amino acid permease [Cyclobacteriaceae bacterium]MCW5901614.1 amino acid permease [Cyclobacteriaceae bacterium]
MANALFHKKPMEVLQAESGSDSTLKRTLSRTNLIALGIGAVIGAGIFVLTGQAAAQYAGPAVAISFIVSALACAFAGLCYAEFAAMIPIAGSAYTYAYATMGRIVAWIIGWALILEYLFSGATVAVGWSGYMVNFLASFGIEIPAALSSAPVTFDAHNNMSFTGAYINLPAVLIVLVITVLLYRGIKESANFNNFVVILKLSVIALFILFGWAYINYDNWSPFIPENTGHFGQFGWTGIFRASAVIFFAYIGFDAVSTAAQEAKNPQKDMPWGILGSLAICTFVYILVSLVMTGMAAYTGLNTAAPIAVAIDMAGEGLAWLSPFIKLGAIAGLSSVILVMLMGQTRVFYSMANDGLFFAPFAKIHNKFQTPYIATIITGTIAIIACGLLPIGILGELVSIGTLLAFMIVCLGILILRYKHPEYERPFKTPFFPYVPILGILCCGGVMLFLNPIIFVICGIWIAIGLVIYFFYGRKNAKY